MSGSEDYLSIDSAQAGYRCAIARRLCVRAGLCIEAAVRCSRVLDPRCRIKGPTYVHDAVHYGLEQAAQQVNSCVVVSTGCREVTEMARGGQESRCADDHVVQY